MVVATGFFDGVHLGHRLVLDRLVGEARRRGEESVVVTFWPHPRNVLQDDARNLRLLTTLSEKKEILRRRLSAREYISDYIIGRLGGTAVVIGYDNRVGGDRLGPDGFASVAASLGLDVIRADRADTPGGVVISSTKIREALAEGKVEAASAMLGYDYSVLGVVVAGNRLGRTIGFPTANIKLYEPLKMLPGNGVYSVEAETLGRRFRGMCNIGVRPTVNAGNDTTVETNIFGFDEDIYGLDLKVTFLRKIRQERRFESLDALKAQLERDKADCMDN